MRRETLSTTASDPNRLVRSRNSTDANQITPCILYSSCAYPGFRGMRVPPAGRYLSLDQYKHECRGAGKAWESNAWRSEARHSRPSGVHAFAEPVDGGFGAALAVRDIERLQADFDHAQRAQDHRGVDVAHMGDPERLALQLANPGAEHDAAFFLAVAL